MREREQPPVTFDHPGAAVDEALIGLVQRARNAEGDERRGLCDQVNATLAVLSSAPDPALAARRVLTLLDDEALHGLVDSSGAECRRRALEAVLSMGFPWALHIEPEDLDYLRARGEYRRPVRWRWWVATLVVAALLFGGLYGYSRGQVAVDPARQVRVSPVVEQRPSPVQPRPGAR